MTLLMLCLASILLIWPYVVWVYGMYAVELGLLLVLAVRFVGSTVHCYLLRAVSIVLEESGEIF